MKLTNIKYIFASLIVIPMVFASAQLHAACEKTERPTIPEYTNDPAEMLSIKKSVEAYMAASNKYLDCQKRNKKRNAMIDEMELVAADYNVLIMLYKEERGESTQLTVR